MTTCCVAGYRPLRDIRQDEATWPPVLAPAGPWEICDCREGDVVRRWRELEAAEPTVDDIHAVVMAIAARLNEPIHPPRCRTCPVPPVTDAPIAWSEQWHTYLCAECAALLAEEKP